METREQSSLADSATPLDRGVRGDVGSGKLSTNHLEVLMNAAASAATPAQHETLGRASMESKVLAPIARIILLSQIIAELRAADASDNPVNQLGRTALEHISSIAYLVEQGDERI